MTEPRPDHYSRARWPDPVRASGPAERATCEQRRSLLIADDDLVVGYTLAAQLNDSFRVVAVAGNAPDAIVLAAKHRPDVALIDADMRGGGAREAVPRIAARSPGTRIVVLSSDESSGAAVELLTGGAVAYMRKGAGGEQIAETLAQALLVDV